MGSALSRSGPALPRLVREERGFTGAEKALLICFALAVIVLVGGLLSRGSQKAATDAERTLATQGGSLAQLGQAVRPIQAAGPDGDPSGSGPGGGTQGGGEGQQLTGQKEGSGWKAGGEGSGTGWSNGKQSSGEKTLGGAPPKSAEEKDKDSKQKGSKFDVEVGVEKQLFEKEGALGEKTFAGGSEKISGGYGKADGTAFAKASLEEGAAVGAKVEGKASALNWQGEHEIIGGIQEKHEVDVLSVKGSLGGKAGISKDVIGATVSGEAGANLAEAKIEGKKVFKLPFIPIGLELGASGSASAGANIGGEATGGYFKGEDGKRRIGFKAGFKAALGLGLGGKLSLNLVW